MKAYLVTKSGSIGEYEIHPSEISAMLSTGRYRRATNQERLNFVQNREAMLRNERHPGLFDVLFVTPRPGARDGYGIVQEAMREYMMEHGIFLNRFDRGQKVVFCYHYPYYLMPYQDRHTVLYTMFETTRFPDDWEEPMKAAKKLVFPAKFCRTIAAEQFGLESKVLPHGIETANFPFLPRNRGKDDIFTFLHYDAFKYRKGWDIALQAFDEEFSPDERVRLVFKTTLDITPPLHEYENVEIIRGKMRPMELKNLLQSADCFLFPTRGEGFGMTPLEAMATGMPAIVPDAFGISEYFDPGFCLGLETRDEKARYDNHDFKGMDLGFFKSPTRASVRKAMREAFEEWKKGEWTTQDEEKSRALSEYAHQFSLKQFSAFMASVIKEQCAYADVQPEQ